MYDFSLLPKVAQELDLFHKDCAVTVALKIADDSCKMDEYERSVFMNVYNALPRYAPGLYDNSVFEVIERAQREPDAKTFARIKALREYAMEVITRPKMKAFKAYVRQCLSE